MIKVSMQTLQDDSFDTTGEHAGNIAVSRLEIDSAILLLEQCYRTDLSKTLTTAKWCHDAAINLNYVKGVAQALRYQGHAMGLAGEFGAAIPILQRGLAAARRANEVPLEKFFLRLLSSYEFELGRYVQGTDHCVALANLACADNDDLAKIWVLEIAGGVIGTSQQHERGLKLFNAALALSVKINHRIQFNLLGYIGTLLQHLGRYQEAHEALRKALKGFEAHEDSIHQMHCLAQLGLNQAVTGNKTGALRLLAQAQQIACKFGGEYAMALHDAVAGRTLIELGLNAQAQTVFERALRARPGVLNEYHLVWVHEGMTHLLSAQQCWKEAYQHLQTVQALQADLLRSSMNSDLEDVYMRISGALHLLADAKLVAASDTAIIHGRGSWQNKNDANTSQAAFDRAAMHSADSSGAALTARQLRIIALVAQGHSNAQIARVLQISANTVRFHLAAVFSKLGAKRRSEAVAIALQRNLLPLNSRT
jgi:DNA-binding CsgD family transcriptional regulator